MPGRCGRIGGGLLVAMMVGPASTAVAQDAKAILVIHTYGHDAPGRLVLDAAFVRTVRESGVATEVYIESADPIRFSGAAQRDRLRQFLRQKYAGRDIAVVVGVYGPALDFLLGTDADAVFPEVPVVATLTRYPEHVPPGVAFTWSGNSFSATVSAMLNMVPRPGRIAVVDGIPFRSEPDLLSQEIRKQVESAAPGIPITYLQDLSLDELLTQLRALPPDSVIVFARQFVGRGGRQISSADAIGEITKAGTVPLFVTVDQQIGTGAVGGVVVDLNRVASDLAKLALQVAQQGSTASIAPIEDALTPMFDWRALQRWKIRESSLPQGSVVMYRQESLWDQYRFYILGAFAIVVVQTGLIAGLVALRIRRRRTEAELRRAYDQNRGLAGRLIHAQEAERARIARDLHDDVSQQLAGLSIMMSGLRQQVGRPDPAGEIDESMRTIQDQTTMLARSVRNLSHELHPSVMQHTGLVATLRRHCAEIEARCGITVSFSAADDQSIAPDVALCLFRVSQEALTNSVRHAQARTVRVQLSAADEMIALDIADDGVGFSTERQTGGLGLRSIDERVRLVGGQVTVTSKPGGGTALRVLIPKSSK